MVEPNQNRERNERHDDNPEIALAKTVNNQRTPKMIFHKVIMLLWPPIDYNEDKNAIKLN